MSDSPSIHEPSVHEIFKTSDLSSSEDPPKEDWSSLVSFSEPESPKKVQYKQGLYRPGSGEICAKYIAISDSDVLRHPYYNYPAVKNPGILDALLKPEEAQVYPTDGQELYLAICEEMNIIPIRPFYRGLLLHTIDLKYYGINPIGLRAMCIALANNKYVVRLDLSSNFLDNDSCYHLGQLLKINMTLQELVLSGCRIKESGVKRLVVFLCSRSIDLLDLSKNELRDPGLRHLSEQIYKGAVIKRLNLSYNELGVDSAVSFAEALEVNNKITHLDLSWNQFNTIKGTNELFDKLGDSTDLVELNMSWSSLKVSKVFTKLLAAPNLRLLDLSNNRLVDPAAKFIANSLFKAKRLLTLDLSCNPISPDDALKILMALKKPNVSVVNLYMDNITVNKEFLKELNEILKLPYRKNTKVSYGEVLRNYTITEPDLRFIVMKRLQYLTQKGKKTKLDIALYFLQLKKNIDIIQPREILRDLKIAGTPVDEDLVNHLTELFPGPMLDKGTKTIKLDGKGFHKRYAVLFQEPIESLHSFCQYSSHEVILLVLETQHSSGGKTPYCS